MAPHKLILPDGTSFILDDAPGVSIIIGANGTGKSLSFKTLATQNPKTLLYVPPEREIIRQGVGTVDKSGFEQYNKSFTPSDILARHWSRVYSQGALLSLTESLADALGMTQQVQVRLVSGQLRTQTSDLGVEYPSTDEASGLINLVTLAAAIFDPSRSPIVIDEPERGLHPQAQHRLVHVIRDVVARHKKQVVLITHSATMIDLARSDDLARLVFVRRPWSRLKNRVAFQIGGADATHYEGLLPRLNSYKREAFFADTVLLVEGQHDRDLIRCLLETGGFGVTLARLAVLPVDGVGDHARYCALVRQIGCRPVMIMDRDALFPSSPVKWSCGELRGTDFNWHGWLAPSEVEQHLKGPVSSTSAAFGAQLVPAHYSGLSQKVEDFRDALLAAETAVGTQMSVAGSIASLSAAVSRLGTPKKGKLYNALCASIIDNTDWHGTALHTPFERVVRAWEECRRVADLFDIILLNGTIESCYRHAGSTTPGKTAANAAEIRDICAIYRARPGALERDYSQLLGPLRRRHLLDHRLGGMPHDAAAAVCGKFVEVYEFVFGAPDASERLAKLKRIDKLTELSPGAQIVGEGMSDSDPWFEVELPLLRGYLSPDGRYRFTKSLRPDVMSRLRPA